MHGNKGKKHTEEHIRKRSVALTGKKLSPQHARKIRKYGYQKGNNNWLGRKHTEKSKEKMSKVRFGRFKGKDNPCWRGGISFEPYSVDWTETLKKSIRQRDKYTCQICGKEPAIQVHHIDYNKKNSSPSNLITLCKSCHQKTSFNREYWRDYLTPAR